MLYDIINYNDITFTICSHEYARMVHFTDMDNKKFLSSILKLKTFECPSYLHEVIVDSSAFICG